MDKLTKLIIEYVNPTKDYAFNEPAIILSVSEKKILFEKILTVGVDTLFLKNFGILNQTYAEKNYEDLLRTLTLLETISKSSGIEFMTFKTLAPFKFVKNDIDIFVLDKEKYLKLSEVLGNEGFALGHVFEGEKELERENFVQIDLHNNVSWDYVGRGGSGPVLFDLNEFWHNRKKIDYVGLETNVPRVEDEIIALLAHSIFQHHYLTLGECLFIGELIRSNSINFNYIFAVGKKYGWEGSMKEMLSVVKTWYVINWQINLDIPLPVLHGVTSDLVFVQGLFSIISSFSVYTKTLNLRSLYEMFIGIGLSMYRYFYYVKFKNTLAFNPLPKDWSFDDN